MHLIHTFFDLRFTLKPKQANRVLLVNLEKIQNIMAHSNQILLNQLTELEIHPTFKHSIDRNICLQSAEQRNRTIVNYQEI